MVHIGPCDEENAVHGLSWKNAVKAASQWLSALQIPRDCHGRTIDLRAPAAELPIEGEYKRMVLEAARRELRKRGAAAVLIPE